MTRRSSTNRKSKHSSNNNSNTNSKYDNPIANQRNSRESSSGGNYGKNQNNGNGVKSSIAYSIVDKWDQNDRRERIWDSERAGDTTSDDESFSSSRTRTRRRSNATFHLDRFHERQQEFCESLEDYRLFWYPASEKQEPQHQDRDKDWQTAMAFHHPNPDENFPWLNLSWEKIVESEDLFRRVCSCHHDLFVSCSSYLTDLSEASCYHHLHNERNKLLSDVDTDEWTEQDLLRLECEDLLTAILPSWERLIRERALLVEAHRPPEENTQDKELSFSPKGSTEDSPFNPKNQENIIATPSIAHTNDSTAPDASYQNNQWVGWLKGVITGNDHADTGDDGVSEKRFETVTAHLNPECAPNQYHYIKLMGLLYFHSLPQERHNRSNPFHLYTKSEREAGEESTSDNNRHHKTPYKQALATWEVKRIEILGKRAEKMQYIVDQSLLPLTPNRNNNGTLPSKPQHHPHEDENYDDTSDRVLTDKIVRLLIRSYLDMESFSAAQNAERVYHRHPNHRKRLLWYVTMCYLKVITKNKKELARSAASAANNTNSRTSEEEQQQKDIFFQRHWECASAAKRICELVSSKHAKEAREFQHCSTIAFEALAILPEYGRRGLKGYYNRVYSLGLLKFGPKVWEALLKDDDSPVSNQRQSLNTDASGHFNRSSSRRRRRKTNIKSFPDNESTTQPQTSKPSIDLSQSLHSKDHRILKYLIQIYSHGENDLHRALRLLEVSLDLYSPHDLSDSLDRSIFHKLLRKLAEKKMRKAHIVQQKKERKSPIPQNNNAVAINEFDTALGLLNSMFSEESWFPTEETFRILFSMIPYCDNPGKEAEKLRFKLEACHFLSSLATNQGERYHENLAAPEANYLLHPLEASTNTLRAWLQTLQQHGGNLPTSEASPSQRSLAILKAMKVGSSSLFPPVKGETTKGWTMNQPPTVALYSLALEVCSRDISSPRAALDSALEIFEFLKSDDLLLEESTCMALIRVLANFSNNVSSSEDRHGLLWARAEATKRVCDAIVDEDPDYGTRNPSILKFIEKQASYLRIRHPDIYEKHIAEISLLDGMNGQQA